MHIHINHKPRDSTIIVLLTLLAVATTGCLNSQADLSPCSSSIVFMTTIKEFGVNQVVLSNGTTLSVGETYEFGRGPTRIQLLSSDEDGAVFLYEETTVIIGEADVVTPSTNTYRCELNVARDDATFQSRSGGFLLQPEDLYRSGWVINQNTELVAPYSSYLVSPDDTVLSLFDVTALPDISGEETSYNVADWIRVYATEERAADALRVEVDQALRVYGQGRVSELLVDADTYFESCASVAGDRCIYLGQYGEYLLIVGMSILRGRPQAYRIPVEDWQLVVYRAEDRLLAALSDAHIGAQ
jgi:hypothetical protein